MDNKIVYLTNYKKSRDKIGFVDFAKASDDDYRRIGFMCGLEIHQQLKTDKKLFCRCPSRIFQEPDDYDAEIIRHMRPTLSELGEYDGTALMEFKTKKNITYRLKNESACTYEMDDTPPFAINRDALQIAIEISLLCKMNIVGEFHIARKQYLDGSIPTGFQRTGIVGVAGEIPLSNKKVRLIQLSIEEDSCREVSDIGHERIYRTDRLGMPLIETVTHPELLTPSEAAEAAHYLRFLVRSTGHVYTGIGASRQDVNVSCTGGTRVEIKGVAHIKWIPKQTHNEAFRQWALLSIRDELKQQIPDSKKWSMKSVELDYFKMSKHELIEKAKDNKQKLVAVNLPGFAAQLSHFTQPGQTFIDEISGRLKVIACLEQPNMVTSESPDNNLFEANREYIDSVLTPSENDAQIIFWTDDFDYQTALDTIEERCQMAFEGVPNETRKSFPDGTTIFERVLPGADRMYPDTDSAPIAVDESLFEAIKVSLPVDVSIRMEQLTKWNVPKDCWTYLLRNNLMPLVERITDETKFGPKEVCLLLAHKLKNYQGKYLSSNEFTYNKVLGLCRFLDEKELFFELSIPMLEEVYAHPNIQFESVLEMMDFKKRNEEKIKSYLPTLISKFDDINNSKNPQACFHWIMGQLYKKAVGNISLTHLSRIVQEELSHD